MRNDRAGHPFHDRLEGSLELMMMKPPMDPPRSVRTVKRAPHQMTDAVTAREDVFVLAHLGIPRVDPARWTLTIDGMVGRPRTFTRATRSMRCGFSFDSQGAAHHPGWWSSRRSHRTIVP
jgi:hypothetical protein